MQKTLKPAERLIVAADFKPTQPLLHPSSGRQWVRGQILKLANNLKGTGVYLKVNSALRACGYDLIGEIQSRGLRVFADLKLFDIGNTLIDDGILLGEAKPEILTTVCSVGISAIDALKAELPNTKLLGVTVLTSLTEHDAKAMFNCSIETAVLRFGHIARASKLNGLILAPKELDIIRNKFGSYLDLVTPNIRPAWAVIPGDDQNAKRSMTPGEAIKAGADRIVVGRPILQAKNPYDAVMRTIDEIASVTNS